MNTLFSWTQLALYFLGPLTFTLLIGYGCYIWGRLLEDKWPEIMEQLQVIMLLLSLLAILCSWPSGLVYLAAFVVVCGVDTFAEQAVSPKPKPWLSVMLRMSLAILCCASFSLFFLMPLAYTFRLFPESMIAFVAGSLFGAFFSPTIIPVFIWLWRNSQTRPGIETHLDLTDGP